MRVYNNKRIYLDYASSTPISARAIRAMRKAEKLAGNPNAIHAEGVAADRALKEARTKIAAELGCKSREIIFTSGITESNNLAILGCARALQRTTLKISHRGDTSLGEESPHRIFRPSALENTHWIVSAIEHASVLACFDHIELMGGKVQRVAPDPKGIVSAEAIKKALRKETVFVSVGWANNEIGTIQPLGAIGLTLAKHEKKYGTKIIFHTDAGQAPLYLSAQVHSLRVDLFSLGSSKLYGPHGIGALYVSNRAELAPIILGGGQERGLRSGTENVALAVGFAEALAEAGEKRERESRHLRKLRDQFAQGIAEKIPGVVINTNLKHSLPHMLNISIPELPYLYICTSMVTTIISEYLMLALDRAGIALSTKSACNEGESASHVVKALEEAAQKSNEWLAPLEKSSDGTVGAEAMPPARRSLTGRAENTLRFSLGRETTASDINKTIDVLSTLLKNSRSQITNPKQIRNSKF